MYLDDEAPIAGGREIWGFPKKLASPKLSHENEVLVGTLHYGSVLCAVASMGYKHKILPADPILRSLDEPSFLLKIMPHVDGSLRICELVRYHLQEGGTHFVADLTLGLGEVVHDYLADAPQAEASPRSQKVGAVE